MKPTIEVHSLLHNEATILPYFMRHYSQFADVIFYESDSTDGSPQIAKRLGAKVIPLPTNNEVNDSVFTGMKNNCWKNSKADWVIVCDTDEFVYHPKLLSILKKTPYTIFYPKEWRMYSFDFPTTKKQIYEEVRFGVPGKFGFNKMNLFKPKEIKEMNYTAGCHTSNPQGNVRLCPDTDIVTLHFHSVGIEYLIKRSAYLGSRLSEENKQNGWGYHFNLHKNIIIAEFERDMKNIVKVL